MSALDPYAQPLDRTAQVRQDTYAQEGDDLDQQRQARAATLASQLDAIAQNRTTRANQNALQTASGDAAQWTLDPHYTGKAWGELPTEAREHFSTAYPAIQGEIPGMFNQQAATATAPLKSNEKFTHYLDPTTGQAMRFDPSTGTASLIQVSGTPAQQPQTDALGNVATGDAALSGLDKNTASVAKQLATYELPVTILSRFSAPQKAQILAAAKAYDPTFDETQYPTRQAAKKDYLAGGKSFQNITAANTVLGHLADLSKAAEQLGNAHSSTGNPLVRPFNYLGNLVKQGEGNPDLTRYNQIRDAVGVELAKTFQGGAPHTGEVKSALENLSSANTPEQTKAAIQSAVGLIGSRLGELHGQYEAAVGKAKDQTWLNPKSRAIIRQLGIDPNTIEPQAGQPAQSEQPTEPAASQSDERIALARKAISDPSASPEHKAAAKSILGIK